MTTAPIEAIAAVAAPPEATILANPTLRTQTGSFEQLLLNGISGVDDKLKAADALATAFTLDESVPIHRVMFALEEARLSFELMLQVRSRLVESYQELMRMQV